MRESEHSLMSLNREPGRASMKKVCVASQRASMGRATYVINPSRESMAATLRRLRGGNSGGGQRSALSRHDSDV